MKSKKSFNFDGGMKLILSFELKTRNHLRRFNLLRPSDAYMRQLTNHYLDGVKPLSELMFGYS